jgi:hypothetical protein
MTVGESVSELLGHGVEDEDIIAAAMQAELERELTGNEKSSIRTLVNAHRDKADVVAASSSGDDQAGGISLRNRALLVLISLTIGLTNIHGVAMRYYLVNRLEATPAIQELIYGVMGACPWNFKILVAFISDCVPIYGYRRKPYMLIGVTTQVAGLLLLGLAPPSIGLVAAMNFSTTFSQVFIGTMWDTLLVEHMRFEREDEKGKLQVHKSHNCRFTDTAFTTADSLTLHSPLPIH